MPQNTHNGSEPSPVTIIGAGLAGLALALTLEQQSIPVRIFEWRQPKEGHILGGAVMLSPNGLRIMDKLGVYDRIKDKGFKFERVDFRDDRLDMKAHYYLGQERNYGYGALRIYRQVIIDEMKNLLKERNVPVHYGFQFFRVVEDSADGIVFETTDGGRHTASMLIGADGIHSAVRGHISSVRPRYTGIVGVTSTIPASALRKPADISDFELPVTIMGKRGAFVMAPQSPNGSEILVGTQYRHVELDQSGWKNLTADTDRVIEMITTDKEDWPEVVQSAMEAVKGGKMNIWPFYQLPKLERWASATGRVVLIGDSAHALPPSAGQGINQAMEDAYGLGLLLRNIDGEGVEMEKALRFWQTWRQARVDKVLELNAQMDKMRLPEAERQKQALGSGFEDRESVSGEQGQLAWLYNPHLEEDLEAWTMGQK